MSGQTGGVSEIDVFRPTRPCQWKIPDSLVSSCHVCYKVYVHICCLMFSYSCCVFSLRKIMIPMSEWWSPIFFVDVSWWSGWIIKCPPNKTAPTKPGFPGAQFAHPPSIHFSGWTPWVAEMSGKRILSPAVMNPVVGWNHHVLAKKGNIDYNYSEFSKC